MMNFRKLFMSVLAAFFLMNLVACSSDDDNDQIDDSPKVSGYLFELGFSRIDSTDNASVIKTTYSFINNQGEEQTGSYVEKVTKYKKITSQKFTKLPATLIVTVKEELNPDVEYTKDQYKLGSAKTFSIRSIAEDQTIIDCKFVSDETTTTIPVANLTKNYPNIITYSYKIDEKGKIEEIIVAE